MKVYLSNPSSALGRVLKQRLTEAGHEITNPLDEKTQEQELSNIILESQCVIVDLNAPAPQVTALITQVKDAEVQDDRLMIGVSTAMTWSQTSKSSAKPLQEARYRARKASNKYKGVRVLESLILNAQKDNLFTYVICPGVLYGEGEDEFHHLFKASWLGEEKGLPILGEGKNIIPTIHVADLAAVIQSVCDAPPAEQQFIVAVDQSRVSQKDIVTAISKGLGNGRVFHVDPTDDRVLLNQLGQSELLMCDMSFENGLDYLPNVDLPWVAQNGLPEVIEQVRQEYVAARGLKPVRVMMHGPPASGKTHHAELLAKEFYLPHIKIGDVIEEALAQNDELAEQLRLSLEDSSKELAKRKKKSGVLPLANPKAKKNNKSKGPEYETARIAVPLLTQALKRKLRTHECRNKGFILDGYPRTFEEAKALWSPDVDPEASEDEEEAEEEEKNGEEDGADKELPDSEKDGSTIVDYIVSFEVSEEEAQSRFKALPAQQVQVGHNDEAGFQRRWRSFLYFNDPEAESPTSPLAFLPKLEVLQVPSELAANPALCLSVMGMYLSKNGKAHNYHPTPEELEEKRLAVEHKMHEEKERAEHEARVKEEAEQRERDDKEIAAQARQASVLREEAELVGQCAAPLRQYLMSHVVPALVEGLVEVCKVQPEDPVDYLAEYLFKCSTAALPAALNGGDDDKAENYQL